MLFDHYSVVSVLEASCTRTYTAVLRALTPRTCLKIMLYSFSLFLIPQMGVAANDACNDLPKKLKTCETFSCERSFSGAEGVSVIINVIGKTKDGKCEHVHRFSQGGFMKCLSSMQNAALFAKTFASEEEIGLSDKEIPQFLEAMQTECEAELIPSTPKDEG